MQALTPEQNEAWKEAILPMVLDFSQGRRTAECSFVALLPQPERYKKSVGVLGRIDHLTAWGVPGWAIHLRSALIFFESESLEPWHWEFGIRSEAALVGVQIMSLDQESHQCLYQRIFVRFLAKVLQPIVEYGSQEVAHRAQIYRPLITLFDLCENFTTPANVDEWPEPRNLFTFGISAEAYPATREVYHVNSAGLEALKQVRSLLKTGDSTLYENSQSVPMWEMILTLNVLYRCRIDGRADILSFYTESMAHSFLTALEAECPPPDWLPI